MPGLCMHQLHSDRTWPPDESRTEAGRPSTEKLVMVGRTRGVPMLGSAGNRTGQTELVGPSVTFSLDTPSMSAGTAPKRQPKRL
jgi:hypothetical protein